VTVAFPDDRIDRVSTPTLIAPSLKTLGTPLPTEKRRRFAIDALTIQAGTTELVESGHRTGTLIVQPTVVSHAKTLSLHRIIALQVDAFHDAPLATARRLARRAPQIVSDPLRIARR
jgi:hypothetical protein